MRIERITEAAAVHEAADLFDDPPLADATRRFLGEPGHHLLLAYEGDRPIGMVTGVETTHPDKGTELFLYELGVAEQAQGRGVARALVEALAGLARERGCYGMWTATEPENAAARAVYARTGADEEATVTVTWDLRDDGATSGGAAG